MMGRAEIKKTTAISTLASSTRISTPTARPPKRERTRLNSTHQQKSHDLFFFLLLRHPPIPPFFPSPPFSHFFLTSIFFLGVGGKPTNIMPRGAWAWAAEPLFNEARLKIKNTTQKTTPPTTEEVPARQRQAT